MYKLTSTPDIVQRLEDGAFIPNDLSNRVWVEYLAWVDGGNVPEPYTPTQEEERVKAKAARAEAVDAITVTTSAGNTFDGDEVSQTRMVRAIIALQAVGVATVNWVLSDNSVIEATVAELSEALALAGAAQAAIWVIE